MLLCGTFHPQSLEIKLRRLCRKRARVRLNCINGRNKGRDQKASSPKKIIRVPGSPEFTYTIKSVIMNHPTSQNRGLLLSSFNEPMELPIPTASTGTVVVAVLASFFGPAVDGIYNGTKIGRYCEML
jgi:hypothetical protein